MEITHKTLATHLQKNCPDLARVASRPWVEVRTLSGPKESPSCAPWSCEVVQSSEDTYPDGEVLFSTRGHGTYEEMLAALDAVAAI